MDSVDALVEEVNQIVTETNELIARIESDPDLNNNGSGGSSTDTSTGTDNSSSANQNKAVVPWTQNLPPALQKVDPKVWYAIGGGVGLIVLISILK